ncbi:hypothetical protein [Anaerorhabdus furcosa]|uniref:hypothetical protein n=1 Tax=Anaerorhabdus furcosa TaxID=118967 RepID=UPI0013565777|nr:hypothetical protein [Anaerorhabdus furcosa]
MLNIKMSYEQIVFVIDKLIIYFMENKYEGRLKKKEINFIKNINSTIFQFKTFRRNREE